jgi:hypothetical protein
MLYEWKISLQISNFIIEAVWSYYIESNIYGSPGVKVNLQRSEVRYKEVEVEVKAKLYLPIQNQDFWICTYSMVE